MERVEKCTNNGAIVPTLPLTTFLPVVTVSESGNAPSGLPDDYTTHFL
jgi:hypothetical protein